MFRFCHISGGVTHQLSAYRRLSPNMFPRPQTKYSRKSVKARGTWHLEPTWQRNRHARVKGTDIHVSKKPPHILHILFLLVLIRLSLKLSLVWEPNKQLLPRTRNRPFMDSGLPRPPLRVSNTEMRHQMVLFNQNKQQSNQSSFSFAWHISPQLV